MVVANFAALSRVFFTGVLRSNVDMAEREPRARARRVTHTTQTCTFVLWGGQPGCPKMNVTVRRGTGIAPIHALIC